jgi:riboflavin transporter FmnP
MDMSTLVAMGTEKNSMITSLGTFIIFGVAPFNLIKYGLVSLVTILVYKRISRLLKKQQ